ncbi:2969_t:CDS:2 [Dentiscutata erythropus]|uniref:2969_t:CDS:1 n=1 Tax=Dentiscutata erythropus TaxID=1348616 RepID=A0A9N8Z951_9GLOM|nr:2969_t:CDS:2 [Dentiscutata erythropus]
MYINTYGRLQKGFSMSYSELINELLNCSLGVKQKWHGILQFTELPPSVYNSTPLVDFDFIGSKRISIER